jgi:hypothetical protein
VVAYGEEGIPRGIIPQHSLGTVGVESRSGTSYPEVRLRIDTVSRWLSVWRTFGSVGIFLLTQSLHAHDR